MISGLRHTILPNLSPYPSPSSIKLIDTLSILSSIVSRRSSSPAISSPKSHSYQSGFPSQTLHKQFPLDLGVNKPNSNQLQSKQYNKHQNISKGTCNLYVFPSSLISTCASYLESKSYFSFARTCIKIYFSCHCPLTLQHLNITQIPSTQSLLRFKCIKSLNINIKYFNNQFPDNSYLHGIGSRINNQNKYVWSKSNCIETLKLSNLNGTEQDMATFINNDYITFNRKSQSQLQSLSDASPQNKNRFKSSNHFSSKARNSLEMVRESHKTTTKESTNGYLRTLALAKISYRFVWL